MLAACDRAVTHMENAMLADLDEAGREQFVEALVNCVYRLGAGFGRVVASHSQVAVYRQLRSLAHAHPEFSHQGA